MVRVSFTFVFLITSGLTWHAAAQEAPSKQNKLESAFEQQMSGAVLVGHFTKSGTTPTDLSEEKYTIRKVSQVPDKPGYWRFVVRIQYGKFDVSVPIDLQVEWAGDTPVITLSNFALPPLGTFSARVLIHDQQYAGTWQHGKVGGHLFGRITRLADEKKAGNEPPSEKGKNGADDPADKSPP